MNKSTLFPIQLASIVVTGVLWHFVPNAFMWTLMLSLGFSHYLLSFVYSRTKMTALAADSRCYVPLGILLMLGAGLYWTSIPLLFFFALHHAFNETYLRNRMLPDHARTFGLRLSGVVLHLIVYFLLIFAQWFSSAGLAQFVLIALFLAAAAYFYFLYSMRRSLGARQILDNCAFEMALLALVPLAFVYQITFQHIVFYHFVFWVLYPFSTLVRARRIGASLRFTGWTAGITTLFMLTAPLGLTDYRIPDALFRELFIVGSFIHITAAFALSAAHPDWIIRWFRLSNA